MPKTVLISTGGSGGHIFPAEAVADEIIKNGWNVVFTTDKKGLIFLENLNPKIKLIKISVRKSSTNFFDKLLFFCFLFFSVIESTIILYKSKPDIVVGFGGYSSFPILFVAYIFRIKSIIHEQNVILGKVNSFFSKKVSLVLFGLKPKELKQNNFECRYIGIPVRSKIMKFHEIETKKIEKDKFTIFVLGGSQGAKILTNSFLSSLSFFSKKELKKLFIYIQCRGEEKSKVEKVLKDLNVRFMVKTFYEDIGKIFYNSDLIISRAGASTISELTVLRKPPILVPLKIAVNDHQLKNALSLESYGAAKIINEKDLIDLRLYKEIENFFHNPDLLYKMSRELKKLNKPNAANDFFKIIKDKVI